jgi:hypothetical protein
VSLKFDFAFMVDSDLLYRNLIAQRGAFAEFLQQYVQENHNDDEFLIHEDFVDENFKFLLRNNSTFSDSASGSIK